MRVLVVAADPPYPADSGGRIRTLGLCRHASRAVELELWCVERPGFPPDALTELARLLGPGVRVRCFPRSRLPRAVRPARARAEGWFESAALRRALQGELAGPRARFDLVHLDELALVRSLPAPSRASVPVLVHHHKLDVELQGALVARHRGPVRLAERLELARLLRLETLAARRYRAHLVCCPEDAARLRARHPGLELGVVPSGVEPGYFAPAPGQRRRGGPLLFLGTLSYEPNVDALERFVAHAWPVLRRARPGLELELVGRDPGPAVRALARQPGLRLVGPVADVRPALARAAALIAPLAIGGGTRLKLVEALAAGTPTVATPAAAEGLPLRDGVHLDLAPAPSTDDPASFAARVLGALADPAASERRAERGRELVERELGWPALALRLVACWRAALASASVDARQSPAPEASLHGCATSRG